MKVLIIEDEMMARRSLEKMLENNFPDISIVSFLTVFLRGEFLLRNALGQRHGLGEGGF